MNSELIISFGPFCVYGGVGLLGVHVGLLPTETELHHYDQPRDLVRERCIARLALFCSTGRLVFDDRVHWDMPGLQSCHSLSV